MNSDLAVADNADTNSSENENVKANVSMADKSSAEVPSEAAPQEDNKVEVADAPGTSEDARAAETKDCSMETRSNDSAFTDAMIQKLTDCVNPEMDGELNLLEADDDLLLNSDDESGTESPKEQEPEVIECEKNEALNLFIQGKRNMVVGDYESAVDVLGQACDKFRSVYGELAQECGEVYFNYGTALLELWKEEEGQKKEDDDVGRANGVNNGLDESEDENGIADGEKEGIVNSEANDDEDAVENEEEDKNEEGEDLEDEVDNLQIAWEVLEMAKTIYIKAKDDMKLATIYTKLGEISIASGNFDLAVDDLKRALEIEKKLPSMEARVVANTNFQLFFAYSGNCNFDEALRHLRTAKFTFEMLLDKCEKLDSSDKEKGDAVKELTEIIREIDEKILESCKEQRTLMSEVAQVIKRKVENQNQPPVPLSTAGSSSPVKVVSSNFSPLKSDVPINNISHLVRKKPKSTVEETKNDPNVHALGDCSKITEKEINGKNKSDFTADSQSRKPQADDKELESSSKKNIFDGALDAQSDRNKVAEKDESTAKKNETNCIKESSEVTIDSQSNKRKADQDSESIPKKVCLHKND